MSPRWVWSDTRLWYPPLLAQGVRVSRCTDLRLCELIVRRSALTSESVVARRPTEAWLSESRMDDAGADTAALFVLDAETVDHPVALDEFHLQHDAVSTSTHPGPLGLLLAAESAGALIAAEMRFAGVPFDEERHRCLLEDVLGERDPFGRPRMLTELAQDIQGILHVPDLNVDSPGDMLRALNRAGVLVSSTRAWQLREVDHPVISPLLRYKKLSRLMTANGWNWLETWVSEGRFHPEYVPGGVVTGRWAAHGGGALQLPKQVRAAVVADPGWKLVVADAAQLEPRILSGLARDESMAQAGFGRDLYSGIVASGIIDTRAHAKVAMLGAMYGATTGDAGRLMPRLSRAFPRAIDVVERAARTGESGGVVTSRLGRSSPPPPSAWWSTQSAASAPDVSESTQRHARRQAREWGRFTRNFVVQATAAEWALCWMAQVRTHLNALAPQRAWQKGAHLVYFLHDEIIVHTPAADAEAVAHIITQCAHDAGRLLFGDFPVEFPVSVSIVDNYAQAQKPHENDDVDFDE